MMSSSDSSNERFFANKRTQPFFYKLAAGTKLYQARNGIDVWYTPNTFMAES